MTTPSPYTRLLDRIERLLWQSQDDRLRAEGWDVTRVGRWRRRYRHPARAARLSRTARTAERTARPADRAARPDWDRQPPPEPPADTAGHPRRRPGSHPPDDQGEARVAPLPRPADPTELVRSAP